MPLKLTGRGRVRNKISRDWAGGAGVWEVACNYLYTGYLNSRSEDINAISERFYDCRGINAMLADQNSHGPFF